MEAIQAQTDSTLSALSLTFAAVVFAVDCMHVLPLYPD